ncbi:MAG: hypothetical protein P4L45_12225 [Ignavibacteriaceae bacterium]|nr:hypothetical protein [Ignavibacteriaceae bacterium]
MKKQNIITWFLLFLIFSVSLKPQTNINEKEGSKLIIQGKTYSHIFCSYYNIEKGKTIFAVFYDDGRKKYIKSSFADITVKTENIKIGEYKAELRVFGDAKSPNVKPISVINGSLKVINIDEINCNRCITAIYTGNNAKGDKIYLKIDIDKDVSEGG